MHVVLYTGGQARDVCHGQDVFFYCARCLLIKPVSKEGGAGYAVRPDDTLVCYACCGQLDRQNMIREGKATLYLSRLDGGWQLSNWPGTLKITPSHVRAFHHPFARSAWIAYFRFDGSKWSARNIGDSQIAHCRRLNVATEESR